MEPAIMRAIAPDLDSAALGLRLRYLSGGMSTAARTVERIVLPERAGYYAGARMVEAAIIENGLPWAMRADAHDLIAVATSAAQFA
jgi:hypothetical protein